jgi:hypothetical protein
VTICAAQSSGAAEFGICVPVPWVGLSRQFSMDKDNSSNTHRDVFFPFYQPSVAFGAFSKFIHQPSYCPRNTCLKKTDPKTWHKMRVPTAICVLSCMLTARKDQASCLHTTISQYVKQSTYPASQLDSGFTGCHTAKVRDVVC